MCSFADFIKILPLWIPEDILEQCTEEKRIFENIFMVYTLSEVK